MRVATNNPILDIHNLHANAAGTPILNGVHLKVERGEIHALMGPNGSGKSTLANVLMGHPSYEITSGQITFKGQDITHVRPDERAKLGLFLAFQYPIEIPGVSLLNFLRSAMRAKAEKNISHKEFRGLSQKKLNQLGMDLSFARRNVNEGFSGGEKKRGEVLQLSLLEPDLALLDGTDSGLDIDGIRLVAENIMSIKKPEMTVLIITHYMRILNFLRPNKVHILFGGQIVQTGGFELAEKLEASGYESFKTVELGSAASA